MYIKEVNICGFRSYRENTSIDSFSPKHNVIVGRNGSGKSNFFFAIQFVLSEEFAHLRQEQRMSILHEGTGPRIVIARVEIVFDNSDRRIPATEASEVRVLRQIAQKKDQYYIDNKLVPRAEVVNLMESAGFSRSNPYYIVKQGKINELATAADALRLKLLKDVAGTRVYDERKEESLKILKETSSKTNKIKELLASIENRMKKLESEKEDLKEYQKWDKQKRSIEYTMFDVEISDARRKLDELSAQREELNSRQNKVNSDLMEVQSRGMKATSEQRKLDSRFKGMKEEKDSLKNEQTLLFEKRAALELKIKDLKDDVERERSGRSRAEDDLEKLKAEIAAKQEELDTLLPEYEAAVENKERLKSDIRIAENRLHDLVLKEGHGQQFKTKEERDAFLKKEIRVVQNNLYDTEVQLNTVEKSLEEEAIDEQQVNDEIKNLTVQLEETAHKLESFNITHSKLRDELTRATKAQIEACKQERERREQVESLKAEVQQQENFLRALTAKPCVNGSESMKKVLRWFEENNHNGKHDDVLSGYYGTLLELINCDNVYFQAVEVTAANRLFYHVVSDDRVAMKLLNKINGLNLPGSFDFFPLTRLTCPPRRTIDNDEARPMLDCFNYDPKFDNVFRQVFGGTIIVRSLEVGHRLARANGFDAVTLEGDQVSRSGTLTGGFIDRKKSKLELFYSIRDFKDQLAEQTRDYERLVRAVNQRQQEVDRVRADMDEYDTQLRSLKNQHRELTEHKKYVNEQLHSSNRNTDDKKSQLYTLKNRIRELLDKKTTIENELRQPLQSQLTPEEQAQMARLQNEAKAKKAEFENVSKMLADVESKKARIENLLQKNLMRKRDNLSAKVTDISVDEKRLNLENDNSELQGVMARLTEILHRIDELEHDLKDYEEAAEKLARELDDVAEQQKDLEIQMAEFSKQVDSILTKQSSWYTKREESIKKIRELGSLPTDAFNKYQNLSAKQLDKKLTEAVMELKKYGNVNKKALDQFIQVSSQKEELTARMEEQQKNEKSIEDLVKVLDNRKYEAILLTFKQVSKNFQEVFAKLVPGGKGQLVMRRNGNDADEEAQSQQARVENFTGVGIRVSFASDAETREMQQLSGGQKTLVALALIFSIQKCDPAPFYLFDEIDAALDPMHRHAVADMIHELAENAQFITTTFRPELLASAEKFFGVIFRNKVSHIDSVSREKAYDFVDDDQTHG